jgi:hypothetical protein
LPLREPEEEEDRLDYRMLTAETRVIRKNRQRKTKTATDFTD